MSLLVSYLYGCLCAFVPCAAYLFVARRGKSRSQGLVLALYLALVMAVTGAGTLWDLLRPSEPGYSNIILNFQPLANGLRRDICLNVVMLVPLGFLLPLWWRDYQRLAPTVVAGAGLSLRGLPAQERPRDRHRRPYRQHVGRPGRLPALVPPWQEGRGAAP